LCADRDDRHDVRDLGRGADAIPWNLIVYLVPGAIIGGQIGARLQGRFAPRVMERAMAILFLFIGTVFLLNVTVAQGLTE
jgi:uncharacterized membrane protein YfcA